MPRFASPQKRPISCAPPTPTGPAKLAGSLSQLVPTRSSIAPRVLPREPQIFTTPKFTNIEFDSFAAEPFRLFVTGEEPARQLLLSTRIRWHLQTEATYYKEVTLN